MRCLILSLLLGGCGSTHAPNDAGMDATVSREAGPSEASVPDAGPACLTPLSEVERGRWHERIRRAWCERIDPCDDIYRWPDVETCMRREPLAHLVADRWLARDGGDVVLDVEAAARCLEAMDCPYWRHIDETFGWVVDRERYLCHPIYRRRCGSPTRASGEACDWFDTCPEDHFCERETCGGTCRSRLPTGALCSHEAGADECMRGPAGEFALCFRERDDAPLRCSLGRPAPPAAAGEPCGPLGGPDDVLALVPCADGSRCLPIGDTPLPRACVARGPRGEPCSTAGCVLGLWCDYDTGTCDDPRVYMPVDVGEPCADDGARFFCRNQWATECLDDVCVEARGEGQPCDDDHWSRAGFAFWPGYPCEPALVCAGDQTCQRPLPLGAECGWPDPSCASGCCRYETGRCADYEVCDGPNPCR